MSANPALATPNLIPPSAQRIAAETSELEPTTLLQRCEEIMRRAFGDDKETIANSLRGL